MNAHTLSIIHAKCRRISDISRMVLCLGMGATAVTACEGLLDIEGNPHTIDASLPVGLDEAIVGATSDLFVSFDSKIVWAGMFGDEFVHSGTGTGTADWDGRRVPTNHGAGDGGRERTIGESFYVPLQRATSVANQLQQDIKDGKYDRVEAPFTDSPEYARASLFDGFAKVWLADMYCTLAFGGQGPELTSADAYRLAEQEFDEAIEAARATSEVRQASYVGRARVRLILGDDAGALADAQQVTPTFEFLATYSTNSFPQRNRVHFRTWDFGNWSVDPSFRDLTIDDTEIPDPRTALVRDPRPAADPSQPLYAPLKVPSASSPLRIATGDEAQLIIAELQGGEDAVRIINELRARKGINVAWAPSTSDPNEIRDKVIEERRRILFLDGVRLGDLRRYISRYNLDFFPTSTPQGFPMGDQTCLPLPDIERNNNPGL